MSKKIKIKKVKDKKVKNMDKKKLIKNYKELIKGSSKEESKAYWLWYLKESWQIDQTPKIFESIQWQCRDNGLKIIYKYFDHQITSNQLYNFLKIQALNLYLDKLLEYETVSDISDPILSIYGDKVIFELFNQIKDLDFSKSRTEQFISFVCTVACTVWFQFMENVHVLLGLPLIVDLGLTPQSVEERNIIKSNDFNAYNLTPEEEAYIKTLLGLNGNSPSIRK